MSPKRISPPAIAASLGSIRSVASEVSVLPLPDSPITPTISPGQMSIDTRSTTRSGAPRRRWNSIDISRMRSVGKPSDKACWRGSIMSFLHMWVEHIAQPVTDQIEAQNA